MDSHPLNICSELGNLNPEADALNSLQAFFRIAVFQVGFEFVAVFFKINDPLFLFIIILDLHRDTTLSDIGID
jgi:hypothetical protein